MCIHKKMQRQNWSIRFLKDVFLVKILLPIYIAFGVFEQFILCRIFLSFVYNFALIIRYWHVIFLHLNKFQGKC